MRTMPQYLDRLWKAAHVQSDYALANKLGVSRGRISNYRVGRSQFENDVCFKAAAILGMDPAEVIADMEILRAKTPEKKALWQELSAGLHHSGKRQISKVASVILSVGLLFGVVAEGVRLLQAPDFSENFQNIEYVSHERDLPNVYYVKSLTAKSLILFGITLCLALSLFSLRQALRPGRRSSNNNNDKNDSTEGLTDGRNPARLPAPSRIVTGSGGHIVRLFPENLPPVRGERNPTGGRARVIEIRRRVSAELAGIPDQRGHTHHAGWHGIASQHLGGLALCATTSCRNNPHATTQDIRAGGPLTEKPTTDISSTSYRHRAHSVCATVSTSRPASTDSAPGTSNKRPAARALRVAAAALFWMAGNAAADALILTGPSQHSSGDYYEHNAGLCYEDADTTDPNFFGIACLYKNSHQNPAAAAALGKRYWIFHHLAIGPAAGLAYGQGRPSKSNLTGLIGGLITAGTEQIAAQLFITPKIGQAPAVMWLQIRFGF